MKNLFNDNIKRIFVAIEFKENIKSYLYDIQNIVIKDSEKGNFTMKNLTN